MVQGLVIDFEQIVSGYDYYIIICFAGIIHYHIVLRYLLAVLRLLCAL